MELFYFMKKVVFYIDGFNFYYGLHDAAEKVDHKPGSNRWKKFYWLDFVKFCSTFLKEDEYLLFVKYFAARPINVGKRERQNLLMGVNKKLNDDLFIITYGKYIEKEITCLASCKKKFTSLEEKQTDVNIAVSILEDYVTGICDKTVLISADSDLLPPLRTVSKLNKQKGGDHKIEVYFPPGRSSSDIQNSEFLTVKKLTSYRSRFNAALMPIEVKLKDGNFSAPISWQDHMKNVSGG
jgi:uncharacterized LabA/DUF88 family protein